ncbi:ABC transporter ATP-binding protein [Paracoccaceae bacterium]|nr:ABC transporter ATP-binding protein [Paracoccaceae bacterium]MDB3948453.1 ABC transporter ATP-binding protein [Paracoccaceae bacterium]
MTIPIIALSNVHLSLESNAGTIKILNNISLNVSTGESLALIGPSGSGKSSLLMLLGGLERASSGSVRVAGTELSDLNEDQLAFLRRDQMGIVFQSFHLIPTMSALENVATPLELAGVTDAFKKARSALDSVGLTHRGDHFPGQLSGGEQQRVALARAVVAQPKILLADEPTGNLDGINGIAIMDLLFSLRDQFGSTLILVTHDPVLANRCNRIIRLHDGEIDHKVTS